MRSEGNSILLLLNHKPAHLVVRFQWWTFLWLFEGPLGELILSTNWLVKASTNSAMERVVWGVVHHTSSCQSAARRPHFHFFYYMVSQVPSTLFCEIANKISLYERGLQTL